MLKLIQAAAVVMAIGLAGCSATTSDQPGAMQQPTGRPSLTSDLKIEPGQEFQYGGGNNGDYTIVATNRNAPAIRIVALDGTTRTQIAEIKQGESATHRFSDGQIAVLVNLSDSQSARADVRVWGDTDVGMGYKPARR